LILATLSTNIAANVVPVANALVNLAPQRISFAAGGVIASLIGIAIRPWQLIANTHGFIYTWCAYHGTARN
jgi:NCS1 family nucleobase:cation symporter-1